MDPRQIIAEIINTILQHYYLLVFFGLWRIYYLEKTLIKKFIKAKVKSWRVLMPVYKRASWVLFGALFSHAVFAVSVFHLNVLLGMLSDSHEESKWIIIILSYTSVVVVSILLLGVILITVSAGQKIWIKWASWFFYLGVLYPIILFFSFDLVAGSNPEKIIDGLQFTLMTIVILPAFLYQILYVSGFKYDPNIFAKKVVMVVLVASPFVWAGLSLSTAGAGVMTTLLLMLWVSNHVFRDKDLRAGLRNSIDWRQVFGLVNKN